MALCGITLNTGTAMIAGVVSGILVDDTIHYLAHFRREWSGDTIAAITRTTRGVGRAVVIANTVLILGFWVGAAGSFLPTVHFSFLIGVTMLGGLACDLLVLPAGLVVADRFLSRRGARA
jgi:predicted RND superfamily exporter protein